MGAVIMAFDLCIVDCLRDVRVLLDVSHISRQLRKIRNAAQTTLENAIGRRSGAAYGLFLSRPFEP